MSAPVVLLPVGHRLGPLHLPGAQPQSVVRVGRETRYLDVAEAVVWDLAHGVPGDEPLCGADRLLAHAAAGGVADPGRVVSGLLARDLVVELRPGDPGARETARRFRARPLLIGLGPGAQPGTRAWGLPGRPFLTLPWRVADRWEDTARCASLWDAAAFAAALGAGDPDTLPDDAARAAQLPAVLAGLPAVVHASCGYLDLAGG